MTRAPTPHPLPAPPRATRRLARLRQVLATPLPRGLPARCAAYAGALSTVGLWSWLTSFGPMNVEQALLHLKYARGLLSVDGTHMAAFLLLVIGWPLALSAVLVPLACVLVALALRGAGDRLRAAAARASRAVRWLPLAIAGGGLSLAGAHLHVVDFALSFQPDEYLAVHYLPPRVQALRPHAPKNLVLIYAESMEADYADKGVFGRNLIQPLTDLHAVSFGNYEQLPGTGWTNAAMVGTQCGIPLKLVTLWSDHNTQGLMMDRFLSRATCLSDLLHQQGYRNVFLGGASLTFGGKGKFLRAHQYDEIMGLEQWRATGLDASHFSGWGLHDDDLFDLARRKLDELHAGGQPFSLVLLTVDTHSPHGQISAECRRDHVHALDGIVTCSSRQIARYVRDIQERGYDRDTQIVVIGDHLPPPSDLSALIDEVPHRSIFNAFISPQPPRKARETLVHFDLLPTILDFIGLQVDGGRMGLGDSGFQHGDDVVTEQDRQQMVRGLQHQSRTYIDLW